MKAQIKKNLVANEVTSFRLGDYVPRVHKKARNRILNTNPTR